MINRRIALGLIATASSLVGASFWRRKSII
jgi:hypothetical protein